MCSKWPMRNFDGRWITGLLAAGVLLLTSCETISNGELQESVAFNSAPSHANVTINNTVVGQTPMSLILPKLANTHVVITKAGFVPEDLYVRAEAGGLTPNPVDVKLRTELLPEKPGADRQAGLETCLANLRKYIAAGSIDPEDAAYAEAQIREFYK